MPNAVPAPLPPRWLAPALITLLCAIWGSSWFVIRYGLPGMPPLTLAAVRFWLAGLAMAVAAPVLQRREGQPRPPRWLWLSCGATNFALSYAILYRAEMVVPSGIAAVLWGVFPLLMALSAVWFLGERLRRAQVLGFVTAFGGIVAVFAGDLGGIGREQLPWAAFLLLSPLVSAVGTTLIKKFGSHCSSVLLNRNGMLVGALLLTALAFLTEAPLQVAWTARAMLATVYLAMFATALTFGVYFWLLRTVPASQLSLVSYVTPVLAILLGEALGDGSAGLEVWLGTALVVVGIALCVVRPRNAR